MGGVPSPQNRAWSQPHSSREALNSEDPFDALLFFVPKTFRIGEEGRDGQLVTGSNTTLLAVKKREGSRAPRHLGVSSRPAVSILLLPAPVSLILKWGTWTL